MKPPSSSGKWQIDREYPRYVVDLRIIVKTADKTAANLHGRTKNMSERGMAATVAGDLERGDIVELQFQLPRTGAPLTVRADIRYRQGFQYGFSFMDLTREQTESIRRALATFPIDASDAP